MDNWDNRSNDNGGRARQYSGEVLTEDTEDFMIGDVVFVGGVKRGKLIFIGQTHFGQGDWAGVALDDASGKNDGMVSGIRYFQCQPNHGTFARLHRLSRHRLYPDDDYREEPYWREDSPPRPNFNFRRSTSPAAAQNSSSYYSKQKSKSPSPVPSSGSSQRARTKSPSPFKESMRIGDRVIIASLGGSKPGTLRFLGQTMFAPGEWAGVELDGPVGKNDGSVGLNRYFSCADKFGLFAPVSKVSISPANRHTSQCPIHQNLERCSCPDSSLYYQGNSNFNSYPHRTTTYREGSYDSDYF